MKKHGFAGVLALVLAAALTVGIRGAGGTAQDPAFTLSYLQQIFAPALHSQWRETAAAALEETYRQALRPAVTAAAAGRLAARQQYSNIRRQLSGSLVLKQGDVLILEPGTQVVVRSGRIAADTTALVDVSHGTAVKPSVVLDAGPLYMMGDTTTGRLAVQSATCELWVTGVGRQVPSDAVDYGSLALGLQEMGLFRGDSGGYRLESTVTRAEALVMFLRLLGVEQEALAYPGSCLFPDAAGHWAAPCIAYATQRGLIRGTSATTFSPDDPMTCQQYTTLLLRALAYEEGNQFTYATALSDVSRLGVFSTAEAQALSALPFCRSQLVYVSFWSLLAVEQDSGTLLLEQLADTGAVTADALTTGLSRAAGPLLDA